MSAFGSFAAQLRSPRSWRVSTRRFFLMLAPISIPVWIALVLVAEFGVMAGFVFEPLRAFWNDPPRRSRDSYHEYGYSRDKSAMAEETARKVILLRTEDIDKKSANL